jgi:hypothetical protein
MRRVDTGKCLHLLCKYIITIFIVTLKVAASDVFCFFIHIGIDDNLI